MQTSTLIMELFMSINFCFGEVESSKLNAPEKQNKENIQIGAKINEIENRHLTINKAKSWFFEKITIIEKTLPR